MTIIKSNTILYLDKPICMGEASRVFGVARGEILNINCSGLIQGRFIKIYHLIYYAFHISVPNSFSVSALSRCLDSAE